MLGGSVTVSGEGHFWSKILMSEGVQWRIVYLQCHPTVISGWNGSYGSMRSRGHVRHLKFGDMGHVKCAMGPKQSLEGVLFGLKPPHV